MSDSSSDLDVEKIIEGLYRDLDLGVSSEINASHNLKSSFGALENISSAQYQSVAFDLSCLAGVSGDWQLAYDIFLSSSQDLKMVAEEKAKIWHLRCLVELERSSEALAIARAKQWTPKYQIHVNYLSGRAFEQLGMKDEAQSRFDAVHRKNPNYRDIAQRRLRV